MSSSQLSVSVNSFAVDLFKAISEQNSTGNVFFSPVSISTCLGMLLLGARGGSEQELLAGLHFDKSFASSDDVHSAFKKVNNSC